MPQTVPPPPPPLPPWAAAMHEEVRRLVTGAGTRRKLTPQCWVGHPAGVPDDTSVLLPAAPPSLRVDLVERALDGLPEAGTAMAWVSGCSALAAGDDELAWWSAVHQGFARHGLVPAAFCLVGRLGWLDLVSGAGRTWSRVRPHPAAPDPLIGARCAPARWRA